MTPIEQANSGLGDNGLDPKGFQLGYQPALDGLRGIAILVVIAFNGHLLWMRGGFVGVDIFFVLSGFLITSLLVQGYSQTSGLGLKKFYIRRALRLLPALFVLVLFCIAYALFLQPPERASNTLRGVLYTLFYVANWAQAPPLEPGIGPLSHAWSLSVEEQFYIIWPILLLVLLKLKSRRLVIMILASLIAISFFENVWMWRAGVPYLRMYFGSDTRANELLIGCVAALLLSWGTVSSTSRGRVSFHLFSVISLAGIFILIFLAQYYGAFVYNGGFTLVCIGTAILIVDFVVFPSPLSRFFESAPLVWIGKISYGLYLWHFPIFEAFRRLFDGRVNPMLYQTAGVVVTILLATGSYYLLERPFLKLRHRYDTNRHSASLTPSPAHEGA